MKKGKGCIRQCWGLIVYRLFDSEIVKARFRNSRCMTYYRANTNNNYPS